jgi:hypothetical protein
VEKSANYSSGWAVVPRQPTESHTQQCLADFLAVMEFPAEWAVFQADEFETATPRSHGKAVMDLMIQARSNGRLLDHFRIATGGSEILEARFQLTDIISNAELEGVTAQFQFWGRDANLRCNMTTSAWLDVYGLIKSNELKLETASWELIKAEKILNILDMMTGARLKSAVIRTCAAVGLDGKMELELQALPLPLAMVNGKPSFLG